MLFRSARTVIDSLVNAAPASYEIISAEYRPYHNVVVIYPQIINMADMQKQDRINEMFRVKSMKRYDFSEEGVDHFDERYNEERYGDEGQWAWSFYENEYTVMLANERVFSVLFKSDDGDRIHESIDRPLTIDLEAEKEPKHRHLAMLLYLDLIGDTDALADRFFWRESLCIWASTVKR